MPQNLAERLAQLGVPTEVGKQLLVLETQLNAIGAITPLTDSSGGTANNTIAVIPAATAASTDTSAASLASTNAALTTLRDAIADIAAKVNAIIGA